jgi:pimeloyl-ACP methyl ester carboxylesterase
MPVLDRDGVGIHYEEHGQGPAVLLSHGYAATCHMWDAQVAVLAPRYRVFTWDMRGHGRSDSPADPAAYSQALTVADMKALLDHCGIKRAVIGGLSLGGAMSLAFHLAYPQMVRALMLCDTGPGFRNRDAREQWNGRALARARDLDARGFAALGSSDEVKSARHRSAVGLAHAARGMLTQHGEELINSLDRIAVPTLVLVGAGDKHFLAAADYMARKIKGATRVTIPDAGHAANLHQPALFNRAVEDFLAGLPQERA